MRDRSPLDSSCRRSLENPRSAIRERFSRMLRALPGSAPLSSHELVQARMNGDRRPKEFRSRMPFDRIPAPRIDRLDTDEEAAWRDLERSFPGPAQSIARSNIRRDRDRRDPGKASREKPLFHGISRIERHTLPKPSNRLVELPFGFPIMESYPLIADSQNLDRSRSTCDTTPGSRQIDPPGRNCDRRFGE